MDQEKCKLLNIKEILKNIVSISYKHMYKNHPLYNNILTNNKEINDSLNSNNFKFSSRYLEYIKNLMSNPEKNIKLSELVLEQLNKLITENLIDLNQLIDNNHTYMNQLSNKNIVYLRKRLIDLVIGIIVKQFFTNDENIWILMAKMLYNLYIQNYTKIHQDSLTKLFRIIVRIHFSCKKQANSDFIKTLLKEMTSKLFEYNEELNAGNVNLSYKNLSINVLDYETNKLQSLNSFNSDVDYLNTNSNSLKVYEFTNHHRYVAILKNPVERLIDRILTQSIDDVCLFYGKLSEYESTFVDSFKKSNVSGMSLTNTYDNVSNSSNNTKKNDALSKSKEDNFDSFNNNNNDNTSINKIVIKSNILSNAKMSTNSPINDNILINDRINLTNNKEFNINEFKNNNVKVENIDDNQTDLKENEMLENSKINNLSRITKNIKNISIENKTLKNINVNKKKHPINQKINFKLKASLLEEKLTENYQCPYPLRSVPITSKEIEINPKYFTLKNAYIKNELEEISGSFGWCCMCRQASEFFCKKTRAPVCSIECKDKNIIEEEKADRYLKGEIVNEEDYAIIQLTDSISIFKSYSNLMNMHVMDNNTTINNKTKLLALELIHLIIDKLGKVLLSSPEIGVIIKDDVMYGLLKNSLGEDIQLFTNSIQLFFKIWHLFRHNLKQEISVYIEKVLLKILDSENSQFIYKMIVLEEFYKMSGVARFYVEIFVNYDCNLEEKDLLNRIINCFCKISQGKYVKFDQLNKDEEYSLRLKSLETITMMIISLFHLAQDQTAEQYSKALEEIKENILIDDKDNEDFNYNDISLQVNTITPNQANEFNIKLDESKKRKNEIKTAVEKFNIKPKNGLNYLRKIGIISKDNEARDIAYFFKSADGLNKDLIGDYLGEKEDLCLKVLDNYTESFDFKNKKIIESIRIYLSGFKLPGEGQKIDRFMQRFANKYSIDNPKEFKRADIAYYIAFAVIMIQTEIHNPHVKNKRGFKGFLEMCRQFATEEEITEEYLKQLYDDIEKKPISLVEFEELKLKEKFSNENKSEIFKIEAKRLYEESSEQLKKGTNKPYLKLCEVEHIEPLINSIWSSLLAVYSLNLEDCDDWNINYSCIEGLECCIKLCSLLSLTMLRDAFVKCLAKLTYLLQGKELKEKHLSCLKTLLNIAQQEIHCFYGSWKVVLGVISSIEFYHMALSGVRNDMEIFVNELKHKKKSDNEIRIEKLNLEKLSDISQDEYEFIFLESVKLTESSFLEFIKSLCEVSREELSQLHPRIFSLQKLVEVADVNMNRIQIQWFKIWKVISDYLVEVGSFKSTYIAEKAVDSLRQLARKFLLKEELAMYHFQKEFLQPFEDIYTNNIEVYRIKEYVITCITTLVLQEIKSIRSGWIVIFSLFSKSAQDSSMDIVKKTFDTVFKIINNHITLVIDVFPDLAYCISKYSVYFPEEVVNALFNCNHYLIELEHIHALFDSMSNIVLDDRDGIRKLAIVSLFNIINKFAINFTQEYWEKFFIEIILKLISTLKSNKSSSSLESLLIEVCELFYKHYSKVDFMLEEFMEEVIDTVLNENESIVLTGIEAIKFLINKMKNNNDEKFWNIICITICVLFNRTNQVDLLTLELDKVMLDEYQQLYQEIVYRNIVFCIVNHNLIEISEIVFINGNLKYITENHISNVLLCLKESFTVAYVFNCEFQLRQTISSQFMSELNQVAALFMQQLSATKLYFKIINKIVKEKNINVKTNYSNNKVNEFSNKSIENSNKSNIVIINSISIKPENNTSIQGEIIKNKESNHSLKNLSKEFIDSLVVKAIADCINCLNNFADRVNFFCEDDNLNTENERLISNMYPILLDDVFPTLEEYKFEEESVENRNSIFNAFINCIPCNILEVRLKLRALTEKLFLKIKEENNNNNNNNNKILNTNPCIKSEKNSNYIENFLSSPNIKIVNNRNTINKIKHEFLLAHKNNSNIKEKVFPKKNSNKSKKSSNSSLICSIKDKDSSCFSNSESSSN